MSTDAMRACKALPWWEGILLRWRGAAPLPRDLIAASPRDENIGSVARFSERVNKVFQGRWVRGPVQVALPDPAVRVRLLFTDALPQDRAERRKHLLSRLADILDCRPQHTRLAHKVMPSPLPGFRHVVLCAVSADKVIRQYERALAESRVRYSCLAPSSLLLFNLFQRQLAGPPGSPNLLLTTTELSSTTVVVVGGWPIFWRTRRLPGLGQHPPGAPMSPPTDDGFAGHDIPRMLAGDVGEAIGYVEDRLGVGPPARILVSGRLTDEPMLIRQLSVQAGLPAKSLDVSRRVRPLQPGWGWNRWEVALGAASNR